MVEGTLEGTSRMTAERDRLRILTQITDAVLSHRDPEGFFRSIAAVIRALMPECDDIGIAQYDARKRTFQVVNADARDNQNTNLGVRTKDTEDTIGGFLMKMGRTMMINDFDALESQSGHAMRQLFPRPFASGIGALLEQGEKILGYFYITSTKKNAFSESERDLVDSVRGIVALGYENTLAYEELTLLKQQAELEGSYLREEIKANWPEDGLIGKSPAWEAVLTQVSQVAPTESTVLIQGETGTGKEVIARAIHERSSRAKKPLIKVNCGALPENLIESELFGHEKGSFTGAMGRRIGRFELANGGTIFLDEIGEMPPMLQVRLLRVLQEREFERVGGEKAIRVDVRVIAATNKNLAQEVEEGEFRDDLFYRLNVFPIQVPPLRVRPEDTEQLARYFLQRIGQQMGRRNLKYSDGSIEAMQQYHWPGNVRELEHLVERGIILARDNVVDIKGILQPGSASVAFPEAKVVAPRIAEEGKPVSLKQSFEEAEKSAIETALEECNGVIGGANGAAQRLGLKRQTLQSKMKKLGISVDKWKKSKAAG